MTALLITNPFVSWLTIQPRLAAKQLSIQTDEICITDTMGISDIENRLAVGDIDEVIFISLHSIVACGGADAVGTLARNCPVPVTIWNVDCTPLVYRSLPTEPTIRYIHASPSDAAYWQRYHLTGATSDCTYGVGPHRQPPQNPPKMAERSTLLLVPINLRWCGRTLEEIFGEAQALPGRHRAVFEQVYEETRRHPDADIPQRVAALMPDDDDQSVIRISRYGVYAAQLWRREWVMASLMDHPVVLDSNYWPPHLASRIDGARATVLGQGHVRSTDDRSLNCRGVLTCSSSHDLYHDRAASGFGHGCLVVAERNAVYPAVQGDAGIVYYGFETPEMGAVIERLNGHCDDLQTMAEAGARRFAQIHPQMGWTRLFATGVDHPDAQEVRTNPAAIDGPLMLQGALQ